MTTVNLLTWIGNDNVLKVDLTCFEKQLDVCFRIIVDDIETYFEFTANDVIEICELPTNFKELYIYPYILDSEYSFNSPYYKIISNEHT